MGAREDADRVVRNINEGLFVRRRAALYALSLNYAALAIQYFRSQQDRGRFWSNQTFQAKDRMFTDAFEEGDTVVGWFMAHGVSYGPYLELANDGVHAAIRPTIKRFAGRFFQDVQRLYRD